MTPIRRRRRVTTLAASSALIIGSVVTVTTTPALATTPTAPVHVSFTLEGCRASDTAYISGGIPGDAYVCSDAAYTTGNLGAGWNELDFVPHRLTTSSGSQSTATTSYSVAVVADNYLNNDGIPGYDEISPVVVNGDESDPSCSVTAGPQLTLNNFGGTYQSIYRQLDITQDKGTTCTFDWYQELAFGSHLNSGSSLHTNVAEYDGTSWTTQGIGARDVSIPIKPILPPTVTKTMSASQNSAVQWSVHKSASPASVTFSDTCDTTSSTLTGTTNVTLSWTKESVTPSGNIDTLTTVWLTNPAHRDLDYSVTDEIFGGTTPGTAGSGVAGPSATGTIAALTTTPDPVIDNVQQSVSGLALGNPSSVSDRATAVLTDPVTPSHQYTLTATDSAAIQSGDIANGAIDISDVERLVNPDDPDPDNPDFTTYPLDGHVAFSVATPSTGSLSGYTAGTNTTGPVDWSLEDQTTSGSVTFAKTITVDKGYTPNIDLYDRADIYPTGTSTSLANFHVAVPITSAATTTLSISKTIPVVLGTGDADETFTFPVKLGTTTVASPTITFTQGDGGSTHPKSTQVTNLTQASYTVSEDTLSPYAPQSAQTVDMSQPTCSGSATFTNSFGPATAQVEKVTVPTGHESGWVFTLTGPGLPAAGVTATTTGTGFIPFEYPTGRTFELQEGSYTVTETSQTNWDNTGVSEQRGTDTAVDQTSAHQCTFTVNYPADADQVFSCTFTNTERANVTVIKTENGATPTTGYSFELTGPDSSLPETLTTDGTNGGTLDFGELVPGSYTLCELAVPAGTTSTLETQYGGTLDSGTGDICLTFTLAAGVDQTFTIDNSHPLGTARTIGYWKNWNTCSGKKMVIADTSGNHLMDEFLPVTLANSPYPYTVSDACAGVNVLRHPAAKYAEHQLAAQLLAAILNVKAGAAHSATTDAKISHAIDLLSEIPWQGSATSTIVGHNSPLRSDFLTTASYLNSYNNNQVV